MDVMQTPESVTKLSQAVIDLDLNASNEMALALAERVADLLSEQIGHQVNTLNLTARDVVVILASHGATWLTIDLYGRVITARVKSDLTGHRMGGTL